MTNYNSARRLSVAVLLAVLCVTNIKASEAIDKSSVIRQTSGAGEWESRRDGFGKRGWQLQLKRRDDGAIEGRIHVVGSNALREARLEGRVDDDAVYGVLVGDDHRQIGTFSGAVYAAGAAGTYAFANGDTGNWSWTDPAARILAPARDAAPRMEVGD